MSFTLRFLILAAKTSGITSITCFTFCDDSPHNSDNLADASERWKTVCSLQLMMFVFSLIIPFLVHFWFMKNFIELS